MKSVVITGATRGIGYGLAEAFIESGCSVMISGRSQARLDDALLQLRTGHPGTVIHGMVSDVRNPDQVQALWEGAVLALKRVDIWVNNAGTSGSEALLWEFPPEQAAAVITTNILGTVYGCQVAVRGMLEQGSGAVYNMEGMGSDGRMHRGLTSYGTSKYAVRYLTRALAQELSGTPIIQGSLRPGMVITDLLTSQYADRPEEFERVKRIFNIIADRVETVAPWLVERMLANTRSGKTLSFTNRWRLLGRFLTAPFHKRNLFEDN